MDSEGAAGDNVLDGKRLSGLVPSVVDLHHQFNDSCDTPLRLYVQRTMLSRNTTPLLHSRPRWHSRDKVTLSQLALDHITLPPTGCAFQSTTRVKCAPVPVVYNRNPFTPRSSKKIVTTTERYNPIALPPANLALNASSLCRDKRRMISWKPELPSPRFNHEDSQMMLHRSRSFMASRGSLPHRLDHTFYMHSKCMPIKAKEVLPSASMLTAPPSQGAPLSQKTSLFYGTGIKPKSGGTPRKALQRFIDKLGKTDSSDDLMMFGERKLDIEDEIGSNSDSFISQMDVGRYSRLSRTKTPGSPILEEEDEEEQA